MERTRSPAAQLRQIVELLSEARRLGCSEVSVEVPAGLKLTARFSERLGTLRQSVTLGDVRRRIEEASGNGIAAPELEAAEQRADQDPSVRTSGHRAEDLFWSSEV